MFPREAAPVHGTGTDARLATRKTWRTFTRGRRTSELRDGGRLSTITVEQQRGIHVGPHQGSRRLHKGTIPEV